MANEYVAGFYHPRRAAFAQTLARAIPLQPEDREAKTERHLLRRLEIRNQVQQ